MEYNKPIMAMYDKDAEYISRLADSFTKRYRDKFVYTVFTELKALREFLTGRQIDILLMGEEWFDSSFLTDNIGYYFILSHSRALDRDELIRRACEKKSDTATKKRQTNLAAKQKEKQTTLNAGLKEKQTTLNAGLKEKQTYLAASEENGWSIGRRDDNEGILGNHDDDEEILGNRDDDEEILGSRDDEDAASEKTLREEELNHLYIVYRYHSSSALFEEIYAVYISEMKTVLREKTLVTHQSTTIVGIYSPLSRCGKTLLAQAVANTLAEQHQVLLISLDRFAMIEELKIISADCCLSDFLYLLEAGEDLPLDSIQKETGGADYILPVINPDDLSQIDAKAFLNLLSALSEKDYSYIILDLSNYIIEVPRLLDTCSYIFMPTMNSHYGRHRENSFYKYLTLTGFSALHSRIKTVDLSEFFEQSELRRKGAGDMAGQNLHLKSYVKELLISEHILESSQMIK